MGPGSYNIEVGGFNPKAVAEKSSGPGKARLHPVCISEGNYGNYGTQIIYFPAYYFRALLIIK